MLWQTAQAAMALLFVLGAAVQYNDPDPAIWIVIYLVAALVSFCGAVGRPPLVAMCALALGAGVWGVWLATGVLGQQPLFDEEGREMFGLAIISLWFVASVGIEARARRSEERADGKQ